MSVSRISTELKGGFYRLYRFLVSRRLTEVVALLVEVVVV
jgi:hypothetical protein